MAVNNLIILRKGTASQWNSANPVLASGEPGYDLTNLILKVGDGVTAWNSLSNHNHSASNISDFNSSVSGLLPVKSITAGNNITISSTSGTYTINSTASGGGSATSISNYGSNRVLLSDNTSTGINAQTNLTFDGSTLVAPNGSFSSGLTVNSINVSVSGHNHAIGDVTGLQSALDGKQASGSYAASSHTHTTSQITDFNSSVSGLVNGVYAPLASPTFTGTVNGITKSMVGLGNVDNTSDTNKPISSATQTALDNKASLSHTHTSSNITDFNSSVSGLVSGYSLSGHTHTSSQISDSTTAGRALLTGADTAAQRTSLGLGTLATQSGTFSGSSSGTNTGDQTISIGGDVTAAGSTGALTATVTKINGVSLSGLSTGLLKNTTGTGAPSIAIAGTDYAAASHTHTSSNITDFNSSVSGLLPTIANSGDNRVLTSTGSTVGINAESSLTFDGTNLTAPYLIASYASGDEGGEIQLAKAPNGTLAGGITIDSYQNRLRFFEQGGSARGFYLDISAGGAGVGTNLSAGGGSATTVSNYADNRVITSDGTSTGLNAESNLTFNGSLLTSPSGSFTSNVAIGSNNLTPTNTLNIINSTNLYLWSTFR